MPQSVAIGLLVLGGVLLLVAVTGGNFKIFEAEVDSPVSSKSVRILSGVLGLVFIGISLSQSRLGGGTASQTPAGSSGGASSSTPGSSAPGSSAAGTTSNPAPQTQAGTMMPASGGANSGAASPGSASSGSRQPATGSGAADTGTGGWYGIVFDPPSNIRTDSSTTADVLCAVTTKTSIHILAVENGSTGTWYKTDYCSGQPGYINHTQVKF